MKYKEGTHYQHVSKRLGQNYLVLGIYTKKNPSYLNFYVYQSVVANTSSNFSKTIHCNKISAQKKIEASSTALT
jgi:hypothetical protein